MKLGEAHVGDRRDSYRGLGNKYDQISLYTR